MAVKEAYETYENSWAGIRNLQWVAQTFTATSSYTLTHVSMRCTVNATYSATITCHIRATTTGLPSGGDLASGTLNANTAILGAPGGWLTWSLGAGCSITSGSVYAIILDNAGETTNYFYWQQTTSSGYSSGGRTVSTDSGATWGTLSSTTDCVFVNHATLATALSGTTAGIGAVAGTITVSSGTKNLVGTISVTGAIVGTITQTGANVSNYASKQTSRLVAVSNGEFWYEDI